MELTWVSLPLTAIVPLLTQTCGRGQQREVADMATEIPSFLALGDSYTIGEGVDSAARWPVALARALRASGNPDPGSGGGGSDGVDGPGAGLRDRPGGRGRSPWPGFPSHRREQPVPWAGSGRVPFRVRRAPGSGGRLRGWGPREGAGAFHPRLGCDPLRRGAGPGADRRGDRRLQRGQPPGEPGGRSPVRGRHRHLQGGRRDAPSFWRRMGSIPAAPCTRSGWRLSFRWRGGS
jgi:hypothetical protein